jgi:hypothetical protein
MSWDKNGRHPILKMTREEIIEASRAITEKYAGTTVNSNEKVPQPTLEESSKMHIDNIPLRLQMFKEKIEREIKEEQGQYEALKAIIEKSGNI